MRLGSDIQLLRRASLLAGVLMLAACDGGDGPTAPLAAKTTPPPAAVPAPPAPPPPVRFDVQIRFIGEGGTERHREAFTKAAARWREVIVADIGNTLLNVPAGECQPWIPAVSETINDLLVFVRIAAIDGPGKIVGQASPCYVNSENKLPIMGFFELDEDDLESMTSRGLLDDVVLHELGHVLGIGTLWNHRRTLLTNSGGDDPFFNGINARSAFESVGGTAYTGEPVPVENTGARGTRDAHWRRSVFGLELMQGFAQPGGMPMSRVTIASLADLGYTVSFARADGFLLFPGMGSTTADHGGSNDSGAIPPGAIALGDDIARAPLYEVNPGTGSRRLVRLPELE
jgi:hypothetical protein